VKTLKYICSYVNQNPVIIDSYRYKSTSIQIIKQVHIDKVAIAIKEKHI